MAAALLNLRRHQDQIVAIIVGADRVAANGDTANKIGTYSLAILARWHGVKFLVSAPRTTIDLNTPSGANITIEDRPPSEVTSIKGPLLDQSTLGSTKIATSDGVQEISIAAVDTQAWNPAFDVTPAELIDAIVTEVGVVEKNEEDGRFDLAAIFT